MSCLHSLACHENPVLRHFRGALFFDGYLPEWKVPTRLQRVCKTSTQLRDYFSSNPTGAPKPRRRVELTTSVTLFPEPTGVSEKTKARLPPPPFGVQVVLETLRQSTRYGPLTELVSGEADPFCAEFARSKACVVLTSDSDLLVFDLGPESTVAFFRDIDECMDAPQTLKALIYAPAQISQTLGLPVEFGLSALAFELAMDPHLPTNKLLHQAMTASAVTRLPGEYEQFKAQYTWKFSASAIDSAPFPQNLHCLDPRVSELVLQCLRSSLHDKGDEDDAQVESRASENDPVMFLPPLLDSWKRVNAWETSTLLREVAYCLIQLVSKHRSPTITEYARVISTSSSGRSINVPSISQFEEHCTMLLSVLDTLREGLADYGLIWIMLSLYWDVERSESSGKESVALQVLQNETDQQGTIDPSSWNVVHLFAQIQATYYSSRVLQQIVAFVRQETRTAPRMVQELFEALSSLPPLPGFPLLGDMADLPLRLRDAGGLQMLADLTSREPIDFGTQKRTKRKRGVDQPKREKPMPKLTVTTSANPFAMLADE